MNLPSLNKIWSSTLILKTWRTTIQSSDNFCLDSLKESETWLKALLKSHMLSKTVCICLKKSMQFLAIENKPKNFKITWSNWGKFTPVLIWKLSWTCKLPFWGRKRPNFLENLKTKIMSQAKTCLSQLKLCKLSNLHKHLIPNQKFTSL